MDHINFADLAQSECEAIYDLGIMPIIYQQRIVPAGEDGSLRERFDKVQLEDIISASKNVFFLGGAQSGKTAVAYALAGAFARGGASAARIPIILSPMDLTRGYYGLHRAINRFTVGAVHGEDVESLVKAGAFAFIVDDLNFGGTDDLTQFVKQIAPYVENIWIGMGYRSVEGVAVESLVRKGLEGFDVMELGPVPRRDIRRLASVGAFMGADGSSNVEVVLKQMREEGLPRSLYIAMLLIWANRRKAKGEKLNEALLLQNVLEHLLGRADFTTTRRGEMGAIGKEIVLQHIAKLFTEGGSSLSENDLLANLLEFFASRRLPFTASNVLEKLVECGILHSETGTISFKYEPFRKVFYALALRDDRALLLENTKGIRFLKYRAELELLSGLRLRNDEMMERIMDAIRTRPCSRTAKYDSKGVLDPSGIKLLNTQSRRQLRDIKKKRLTQTQVDDVFDQLDERAQKRGETGPHQRLREEGSISAASKKHEEDSIDKDENDDERGLSLSTLMACLAHLGKIAKNSDFSDFNVKGPALQMVLEGYVQAYLAMIGELAEVLSETAKKDDTLTDEEIRGVK